MRSTFVLLGGLICLASLAGCGTGDYETKFENATKNHEEQKKFSALEAKPTEIKSEKDEQGLNIFFRAPRAFLEKEKLQEGGDDPQFATNKVPIDRVFPPFPSKVKGDELAFKLPGRKITYEGLQETEPKVFLPFYLYVAGTPQSDRASAMNELRAHLQAGFSLQIPNWENVEIVSQINKKPLPWKKLRLEEKQMFQQFSSIDGKSSLDKHFGIFELWLCETDKYRVMFAWRWPKEIEEKAPVGEWAKLTAATLDVRD